MLHRCLLLFLLIGTLGGRAAVAADSTSLPEAAVMAGDWPAVARLLAETKTADPIAVFLAGHAFLASDRPNEAVCAFAAGTPEAARAAWRAWTDQLALAHPDSAVALYLRGDALAREKEWAASIAAFSRALDLAPASPLVLNARAVAEAGAGKWNAATGDLLLAAAMPGAPRDVRTNQAVLAISHRDDPIVADQWFSAILREAPTHAIALVGRGTVAAVERHWDAARQLYRASLKASACVPLAMDDILLANQAEIEERRRIVASRLAAANPGTAVYKNYQAAANTGLGSARDSTLAAANAIGALNNTGSLSAANFQNPNDTTAKFWGALSSQTTGSSIGTIGAAIGGQMLVDAVLKPKGEFSMWEGAGGVGVIATSQFLQNLVQSFADKASTASNLMSSTPAPPPARLDNLGGLRSEPPGQAWDSGDWPVVIWPVLLYAINPATN